MVQLRNLVLISIGVTESHRAASRKEDEIEPNQMRLVLFYLSTLLAERLGSGT